MAERDQLKELSKSFRTSNDRIHLGHRGNNVIIEVVDQNKLLDSLMDSDIFKGPSQQSNASPNTRYKTVVYKKEHSKRRRRARMPASIADFNFSLDTSSLESSQAHDQSVPPTVQENERNIAKGILQASKNSKIKKIEFFDRVNVAARQMREQVLDSTKSADS